MSGRYRPNGYLPAIQVAVLLTAAADSVGVAQPGAGRPTGIIRFEQVIRLLETGTTPAGLETLFVRGACYLGPGLDNVASERLIRLGATDALLRALTAARCRATGLRVSPARVHLLVGEEQWLTVTVQVGDGMDAPGFPIRFESLDRRIVSAGPPTEQAGQSQQQAYLRGMEPGTTKVQVVAAGLASFEVEVTVETRLAVATGPNLPDARAGEPYRSDLALEGGGGPVRWRLAGGALAPGLRVGDDGSVAGTPSGEGVYVFRVAVEGGRQVAERELHLRVNSPPPAADPRPAVDSTGLRSPPTPSADSLPSSPRAATPAAPADAVSAAAALRRFVVGVEGAVKARAVAGVVAGGGEVDQFVAKSRGVREVKLGPAAPDVVGAGQVDLPLHVVVDRGFGTSSARRWALTVAVTRPGGQWEVRAVTIRGMP